MIPKKSFYFVRHGITPWNLESRIQGSMDIELHDIGREQARTLQTIHEMLPVTHIFYSPMKRAKETMDIINTHRKIPATPLTHLREWHRGDLEGKLISYAESVNHTAADAESELDFYQRTCAAMHHIAQHNEVPLIVAHAGTYKALCNAINIPVTNTITNCTIMHFKAPEDVAPDAPWIIIPV